MLVAILVEMILGTFVLRRAGGQDPQAILETILSCNADARLPSLPVRIVLRLPLKELTGWTCGQVLVETRGDAASKRAFSAALSPRSQAAINTVISPSGMDAGL